MRALILSCCVLLLTACGSFHETVQKDDVAWLQMIGQPQGELLYIDDSSPLVLGKDTRSFDLNGKVATKISIGTGMHELRVVRGNSTVIHRKFYVSSGNVFEVNLK